MSGRKRTQDEIDARQGLADEFKAFRNEFLFTQKKLSDTLGDGACRRTIQMIENAKVTPNEDLIRRFRELVKRHKAGKVR